MSEPIETITRRWWDEGLNKHNVALADELIQFVNGLFLTAKKGTTAMRTRSTLIPLLTLTLAGAVCAQTKFSGELKCGKPGPMYTLAVGDRPDHTFRIGKQECTWTKPFVVEGITSVSEEVTYFMDLTGDKASARSLNVGTMSNGDKYYVSTQSSGIVKNDVIQRSEVTWTWTGGTGKLRGLTAKGTSKGKGAADGTIWVAEGEYRVAK